MGDHANSAELTDTVARYMRRLTSHPDRHVGGEGNLAATALFAEVMGSLGLRVARESMPCWEWQPDSAELVVADELFALGVGPYTLSCDIDAPLVSVSTIEELEREAVRGAIVLLHGEIAAGQYMPRHFTFYNPESHRRVYRALDAFAPAAVVAATGRDPQMVGSQYPFPLFEDGDLDVPNAFTTDAEGDRLRALGAARGRLHIASARVPAVAEHVVASIPGMDPGRILVTAHIDSRRGSPGALDNASGVATLLVVAGLVEGRRQGPTVEFVPFNGEDDYANPGELRWIAENEGSIDDVVLAINIDDSGQIGAGNCVSFYGCPEGVERAIREAMKAYPDIHEGPQWFQGDHAIFGIYGRPAIAIASAEMTAFMAQHAHTASDTADLADPALIARTAVFIADVIARLSRSSDSSAVV